MNIEGIVNDIIQGMTLRKVESKYGIDRKTLKARCMAYLEKNAEKLEEFQRALSNHKKNSTQVEVSDKELANICEKVCGRRDTVRNIANDMQIDERTLREKMLEFLNREENAELLKRYIEYQATIHPDYSHINFKAVVITMMREDVSQSQIASELGIPARTISREIEKLKESDKELYEICKEYSYRKMQRREFSKFERMLMESVLMLYAEETILKANAKPKRQIQYEKAKENVRKADEIEGTTEEKARTLGISVSTLRRNRLLVQKYENEQDRKGEESWQDIHQ